MPKKKRCPKCDKFFEVPDKSEGMKWRCPYCKLVINLKPAKSLKENKDKPPIINDNSDTHPLIQVTVNHASRLKKYGKDLQMVYALIRKQMIHKKEYEKQKGLLKKEVFAPIIESLLEIPDTPLSLNERIELWYLVFELLPYKMPENDTGIVFNIYPRYEYAALVGLSYVLGGFNDKKTKKTIYVKAVKGERTSAKMKKLFQKITGSPYKKEFSKRTAGFIKDSGKICKMAPKGEELSSKHIEEDFNFGFSWIAFYLPA